MRLKTVIAVAGLGLLAVAAYRFWWTERVSLARVPRAASVGAPAPAGAPEGTPGAAIGKPPPPQFVNEALDLKKQKAMERGAVSGQLARDVMDGRGVTAAPRTREQILESLQRFETRERKSSEAAARTVGLSADETARLRDITEAYLKETWDVQEKASQTPNEGGLLGPESATRAREVHDQKLLQMLGADRYRRFIVAQMRARRELRTGVQP